MYVLGVWYVAICVNVFCMYELYVVFCMTIVHVRYECFMLNSGFVFYFLFLVFVSFS